MPGDNHAYQLRCITYRRRHREGRAVPRFRRRPDGGRGTIPESWYVRGYRRYGERRQVDTRFSLLPTPHSQLLTRKSFFYGHVFPTRFASSLTAYDSRISDQSTVRSSDRQAAGRKLRDRFRLPTNEEQVDGGCGRHTSQEVASSSSKSRTRQAALDILRAGDTADGVDALNELDLQAGVTWKSMRSGKEHGK